MIRIDYETRSRADLRKVGQWRYAQDPSTGILCFAYKIDDGHIRSWRMGEAIPKDLIAAIKRGDIIVAFNANFERAITECCGVKLGIPLPKVEQWRDTQAIALMCSLPASLEMVAQVLGTRQQKDKEGKALINKFSKPKKDGTFAEPKDHPHEFARLVAYCKQDVATESDVYDALPIQDLGVLENKVWQLDSDINRRGIPMDMPLILGAVEIERRAQATAQKELSTLTKGMITAPGQGARIVQFASEHGCDWLKDVKSETLSAAMKRKDLPQVVRAVIRVRQRTSQAAVKKYTAAKNAMCHDNKIRSIHGYHGAHTGRWTAKLLQTQNLARPKLKLDEDDNQLIRNKDYEALELLYGDPMSALRDAVRHIIRAPNEFKLIACDLASIEARVLGWLAQDPRYLKAFREGLDLYIVTAAEIFGVPYKSVTDDQRWVGKQAVLALGYSMGVDTFYDHCVKHKPDISKALLDKAVKSYRKTYNKIVSYWYLIEQAAISAVANPKSKATAGTVTMQMVKGYLTMLLPSGRRLWYPEAKIVLMPNRWGGDKKAVVTYKTCINRRMWISKTTYGGRLAENAVQAIARDVMVHGMLAMEKKNIPIAFHVHDEVIACVPRARMVSEVVDCMTAVPSWAPGLPLGAKGFETQYYRKT